MRKRTSDYSSDTEPPPLPQQQTRDIDAALRCPLSAPATFLDAKIAYDNGGDEVRRFLVQECSLIFECNACRSMFRDLANFISHKRFYCCVTAPAAPCNGSGGGNSSISSSNGFPDAKSNALIAATAALAVNAVHNGRFSSSSSVESADVGVADVLLYDEPHHHQHQQLEQPPQQQQLPPEVHALAAEGQATSRPVNADTMALVQVEEAEVDGGGLSNAEKSAESPEARAALEVEAEAVEVEMNAVHSLITKMEHILTEPQCEPQPNTITTTTNTNMNIHTTTNAPAPAHHTDNDDDADDHHQHESNSSSTMPQQPTVPGRMKYSCGMCNLEFQSEKSRKMHMQRKHMSSAHTFKCPSCALTFMQPTAVIRHLATDHKKSVRRIRMTRDTKRRLLSEETQTRGGGGAANRELRRLQSTDSNVHEPDSGGGGGGGAGEKRKVMSNCIYCEKSFERRAALSTHLMSCRVKLEALEKPPPIKRARTHQRDEAIKDEEPSTSLNSSKDEDAEQYQEPAQQLPDDEQEQEEDEEEEDGDADAEAEAPIAEQQLLVIKREYDSDEGKPNDEPEPEADNTTSAAKARSYAAVLPKQEAQAAAADTYDAFNEPQAMEVESESDATPSKSAADMAAADGASAKGKSKELSCRCKICNKQFNALSNLRRHISMFHYRARKFGCTLCEYRAFRRYDIVNHLGFVHKMSEDREMLATEYVSVHEVLYSKDDMDGDIVVLSEEQKALENATQLKAAGGKTYEKRPKRTRTSLANGGHAASFDEAKAVSAADSGICGGEGKATRQKLRRAASAKDCSGDSNSGSGTGSGSGGGSASKSQKRPIRNRIKPENKDFVYDLSTLLKEDGTPAGDGGVSGGGNVATATVTAAVESASTELRSSVRRRNTIYNAATGEFVTGRKSLPPLIGSGCRELVKSSMRRICLLMVSQGRAKLATQPELPAERPQMRPRLTSTCRMDMQAVPVIETSDLEAARRKSTILEDSFLEKISRRQASGFRIKPCLELEHTALDTLLQKVDSSRQQQLLLQQQQQQQQLEQEQNMLDNTTAVTASSPPPAEANRSSSSSTERTPSPLADFQSLTAALTTPPAAPDGVSDDAATTTIGIDKQYFISPLPSIPVAASTPPLVPRKRITLVQRMADNKAAKQRERGCLLRTALEHSN